MESNEKVIRNAADASRRLAGDQNPADIYHQAVDALKLANLKLDEVMPEDLPLDPVTNLRSGLDQVATMSMLPPGAPIEERIGRVLENIITTTPNGQDQTLRSMEGSVAVGMISSIGTLGAAIESRKEFVLNNASNLLRNAEAADAVFDAVQKAKNVLKMILPGMTTTEQISALQNELHKQITGKNLTLPPKPASTKLDKARKVVDTVLGPDLRRGTGKDTW